MSVCKDGGGGSWGGGGLGLQPGPKDRCVPAGDGDSHKLSVTSLTETSRQTCSLVCHNLIHYAPGETERGTPDTTALLIPFGQETPILPLERASGWERNNQTQKKRKLVFNAQSTLTVISA